MKDWKTTAFGIGAAVLLIALTFAVKHTIDIETLTVAAGMVGIGVSASDAKTDVQTVVNAAAELQPLKTVLEKPAVQDGLKLADAAISLADASHPTNVLLTDIKTGIDALNSSIQVPAKA